MKKWFTLLFSLITIQSFSQDSTATLPSTTKQGDDIFTKVDVEASVDYAEWRKHLEKELAPVIEEAIKRKAKAGQYTVNVRFIVEKNGSITSVKAMNDPGYGLAEGAVKVVQSSPKWKPGKQKGKKVRSYRMQPIAFVITDE